MASTSDISKGPVLTVITKRILQVLENLNCITEIENSNQSKNKEQEDLLLSKPSVVALNGELEIIRSLLTAAVKEEVENAVSKGPVLTVITNRIRGISKKLERITQIEKSGEIKNKEQQEFVDSKPSLFGVKAELEMLLLPLTAAVDEEIEIARKKVGGCDVAGKKEQKSDMYILEDVAIRMEKKKQPLQSISEDLNKSLPEVRELARLCIERYEEGLRELEDATDIWID